MQHKHRDKHTEREREQLSCQGIISHMYIIMCMTCVFRTYSLSMISERERERERERECVVEKLKDKEREREKVRAREREREREKQRTSRCGTFSSAASVSTSTTTEAPRTRTPCARGASRPFRAVTSSEWTTPAATAAELLTANALVPALGGGVPLRRDDNTEAWGAAEDDTGAPEASILFSRTDSIARTSIPRRLQNPATERAMRYSKSSKRERMTYSKSSKREN